LSVHAHANEGDGDVGHIFACNIYLPCLINHAGGSLFTNESWHDII